LRLEWVWGLLQPGFVRWAPASQDHFNHCSNDVDFTKNIAKSFADRCKSRLKIQMFNATLVQALCTTKMTTFHFRENNFASYNESDVSKRYSRRLHTVLPLRSCLYDASISSYRRSNSQRCSIAWRLNDDRRRMRMICLKGTRIIVYNVWLCRRGTRASPNLGSDFKRSYLENG